MALIQASDTQRRLPFSIAALLTEWDRNEKLEISIMLLLTPVVRTYMIQGL
ncbi:hypothetical protein [Pseudarthrobacter sp. TAF60_1]|uniref:hypothetical protein n=1 Tax=Pseudarthrobacter sp. TAF60_1 TaxID=3233071 RepID=UPI003F9CBA6D